MDNCFICGRINFDFIFYIRFEDCVGKKYLTIAKIRKVRQVDDPELQEGMEKGIEIWKVITNSTKKI
ncbi:MAG: hypothetical protein COT14_03655 [Candidatus Diapherotrites archaeon CG08_land_8_20_14_0_20_30_16]|nr:MAG: hypothetical protein COT14_03655 [Candidatus Diapherotrites archaeon CG08_land_8_20_14_0_20_30_16]